MQESRLSAGLMEKILEGVLCQIRKLKTRDLEKFILEMNKKMPEVFEEKIEKQTVKSDDLGVKKDGSL
jgi:Ni,Fe-hydrogenase III large subunit